MLLRAAAAVFSRMASKAADGRSHRVFFGGRRARECEILNRRQACRRCAQQSSARPRATSVSSSITARPILLTLARPAALMRGRRRWRWRRRRRRRRHQALVPACRLPTGSMPKAAARRRRMTTRKLVNCRRRPQPSPIFFGPRRCEAARCCSAIFFSTPSFFVDANFMAGAHIALLRQYARSLVRSLARSLVRLRHWRRYCAGGEGGRRAPAASFGVRGRAASASNGAAARLRASNRVRKFSAPQHTPPQSPPPSPPPLPPSRAHAAAAAASRRLPPDSTRLFFCRSRALWARRCALLLACFTYLAMRLWTAEVGAPRWPTVAAAVTAAAATTSVCGRRLAAIHVEFCFWLKIKNC